MASIEGRIIEEGMVMGFVKTSTSGSKCEFGICSVDDWLEKTEEEAEESAKGALYDSGVMEWWY